MIVFAESMPVSTSSRGRGRKKLQDISKHLDPCGAEDDQFLIVLQRILHRLHLTRPLWPRGYQLPAARPAAER